MKLTQTPLLSQEEMTLFHLSKVETKIRIKDLDQAIRDRIGHYRNILYENITDIPVLYDDHIEEPLLYCFDTWYLMFSTKGRMMKR